MEQNYRNAAAAIPFAGIGAAFGCLIKIAFTARTEALPMFATILLYARDATISFCKT